jgi:hypothetical protein
LVEAKDNGEVVLSLLLQLHKIGKQYFISFSQGHIISKARLRETKERRPLLTVETEAKGDSKSTNKRGTFLLCWFVELFVPVQEICVLPWLL